MIGTRAAIHCRVAKNIADARMEHSYYMPTTPSPLPLSAHFPVQKPGPVLEARLLVGPGDRILAGPGNRILSCPDPVVSGSHPDPVVSGSQYPGPQRSELRPVSIPRPLRRQRVCRSRGLAPIPGKGLLIGRRHRLINGDVYWGSFVDGHATNSIRPNAALDADDTVVVPATVRTFSGPEARLLVGP